MKRLSSNDPDILAEVNLGIAYQVANKPAEWAHNISEYDWKVALLVTDPKAYFAEVETHLPLGSRADQIRRKMWYRRFIKTHPRYSEGYIASSATLRKWRGDYMTGKRKTFSDEEKEKALHDLKEGMKAKDVAVKYGVSYNSLMKWKAGPEAAKEHQRGRSDDGAAMEQAVDAIKKVLGVIKRTEKMRRQLKKML